MASLRIRYDSSASPVFGYIVEVQPSPDTPFAPIGCHQSLAVVLEWKYARTRIASELDAEGGWVCPLPDNADLSLGLLFPWRHL